MPTPHQPGLFDDTEDRAAAARVVEGVTVREVRCRSLLNGSSSVGYSFNCYTGCAHACGYCYARFMQRFHPHAEAWGAFVDVKINAVEILTKQLRRLSPGSVFTCSACDGWQELERGYELTRRCCRLLLDAGFRLNILTKSDLILRDLDILAGGNASVGVTITTPDEDVARVWEPRASSVEARVRVLHAAKAAGLRTTVMFGPLLPGLSDTPEALDRLFEIARAAEVDRIWTDALNARPLVWPSVQEMVTARWPGLLEQYRRVMFDTDYRETYQGELDARIRAAAEKHRLLARLA
jgi:DNA repair photolyase